MYLNRLLLTGSILCLDLLTAGALSAAEPPAYPFPQHMVYTNGTILPGFARQDMDNDIRTFYDAWKARYLVKAGTAPDGTILYRVSYGQTNPGRTVSEGQGYGMLIVTLMAGYEPDARTIADGLWSFARQHPSSVDQRLMAWEVPENPDTGIDAAFDGDADMAHALFLADSQWGSDGPVNYRQEALHLLTAIQESMTGPDSRLPMLGDWIIREHDPTYNQYTPRSSDFMPDHFRSWYRLSGDIRWQETLLATQETISEFQTTRSPDTGLLPDFLVPVSDTDHNLQPAPPYFLEGPHDGHYEYNAGRDPWRIATDALLNGDPLSMLQAGRMADWIVETTHGVAADIKDGYTMDGTPLRPDDDFTSFFASPFGVAVMLRPGRQDFLNQIYLAVRQRHEDYYEDSVTLLCLLTMTGNMWDPAARRHPVATPPPASSDSRPIPAIPLLLLDH